MKKNGFPNKILLAAFVLLFVTSACGINFGIFMNRLQKEATYTLVSWTVTVNVGPENAEKVTVDMLMGAGRLSISGGAGKADLLRAEFTYNIPEWQPEVEYSVNNGEGNLTIRHPDKELRPSWNLDGMDDIRYEWDLNLT